MVCLRSSAGGGGAGTRARSLMAESARLFLRAFAQGSSCGRLCLCLSPSLCPCLSVFHSLCLSFLCLSLLLSLYVLVSPFASGSHSPTLPLPSVCVSLFLCLWVCVSGAPSTLCLCGSLLLSVSLSLLYRCLFLTLPLFPSPSICVSVSLPHICISFDLCLPLHLSLSLPPSPSLVWGEKGHFPTGPSSKRILLMILSKSLGRVDVFLSSNPPWLLRLWLVCGVRKTQMAREAPGGHSAERCCTEPDLAR